MSEHFVIIGGDAAGMSAASKARRENPDLEIEVLEKGDWASYGACGLPYYLKGDVESLEDLIAIPPEKFIKERNINLRFNHEVTRISPEGNYLTVSAPEGKVNFTFDKLLISTGATACKPGIDGINSEGVFTLHGMEDGKKIKEYLEEFSPKSAAIIGGGYMGIEMVEALSTRGVEVHLVEMLPHVLSPFDPEISKRVEGYIEKFAELHLGQSVQRIKIQDKGKLSVRTVADNIIAEMVLVATGVVPEVSLAKEAGINLGPTGAIATDEYGRTNYSHIFAAGDCAEVKNVVTGQPDYIPLALAANRHGRAIGQTVGGNPTRLSSVAGTAALKVFDLEVARTGIVDPERARKSGFNPVKSTIETFSRAYYYPGSKPIKVSLIADRDSKCLLGASMVGEEGVSKRIDIIAAALHGSFSVEQLENLDLSYAPPFGPVWDPVLTAAKVLNGKLT